MRFAVLPDFFMLLTLITFEGICFMSKSYFTRAEIIFPSVFYVRTAIIIFITDSCWWQQQPNIKMEYCFLYVRFRTINMKLHNSKLKWFLGTVFVFLQQETIFLWKVFVFSLSFLKLQSGQFFSLLQYPACPVAISKAMKIP